MKKTFLSLFAAAVAFMPLQAFSQGFKTSGTGVAGIVPAGWQSTFETGDLNKDGIADLVIIAMPCDEENMKIRDDGYVYNFNQPVLAIYWGQKNGNYKLYKQYDNVIPARPSEFMSIESSLEIAKNGSFRIMLDYFASAGSWTQPRTTHVFSYRNGDFFLIGKDVAELERNTGKTVVTSENYLTRKRIVTTERPNRKPVVERINLPKANLKPLGFNLDETEE